jgi:pseudouridylate synthase
MRSFLLQHTPHLLRRGDLARPAVALESTVISHGLPYPQNLATALRLEDIVRQRGAEPLTVGVIAGEVVVGLDRGEIERLATAADVRKVSRRDLPIVVARQLDGATTVATTAWAAHRGGVSVFATGGIGGVHRTGSWKPETENWKLEAESQAVQQGRYSVSSFQYPASSFLAADISADLPELAQTPIIVVCAGAKAILDLPATLEWLETHGVTVVGYGTDRFPAFYHRDSGLPVDVAADTPGEVADLFRAQRELELPAALLVTVPVPAQHELPAEEMNAAIGHAMKDAAAEGVKGKALTPYLLARVSQLTGEASLRANLALLENNARVAAEIAVALQP